LKLNLRNRDKALSTLNTFYPSFIPLSPHLPFTCLSFISSSLLPSRVLIRTSASTPPRASLPPEHTFDYLFIYHIPTSNYYLIPSEDLPLLSSVCLTERYESYLLIKNPTTIGDISIHKFNQPKEDIEPIKQESAVSTIESVDSSPLDIIKQSKEDDQRTLKLLE